MTNSRFAERTRGVTLKRLDLSGLAAQALDVAREAGKDYSEARVGVGGSQAVTRDADGTLWILDSEGVGYPADGEVTFPIYLSNEGTIAIMPTMEAKLTEAELDPFITDDEVDLADFVRTFGDRLESNFWTLHRTLKARR